MIRVCHLIPTLNSGGAEHMLIRLVHALREQGSCHSSIVTLAAPGVLAAQVRAAGIEVSSIGMRPGVPDPRGVLRTASAIRESRPDVLQTWMYHADFIGGIAGYLAGAVPVIWNIRHSNLDRRLNKQTTLWTATACAQFSRILPRRIVCCSGASLQSHVAFGYAAERMQVIHNGVDVNLFKPDANARESLRYELDLPAATPVIGLMGRWDPQKDLGNFFEAAARIASQIPNARFVLLGAGLDHGNQQLMRALDLAGIADRCLPLGYRADVARILAGIDVTVSSSRGEGFPNAIAEAMACGSLCVATDVGESGHLLGDAGRVVPPQDPLALSAACVELLLLQSEKRLRLQTVARRRIEEHFSLAQAARNYGALYENVAGSHPIAGSRKCAA